MSWGEINKLCCGFGIKPVTGKFPLFPLQIPLWQDYSQGLAIILGPMLEPISTCLRYLVAQEHNGVGVFGGLDYTSTVLFVKQ